jgi:hypothetical protein
MSDINVKIWDEVINVVLDNAIIQVKQEEVNINMVLNSQWPAWPPGKSAYEIYVENWWTSSYEEWSNNLIDWYSKTEIWDITRDFSTDFENIYLS